MTTPDSDELTTLRTQLAEAESRAGRLVGLLKLAGGVARDYGPYVEHRELSEKIEEELQEGV